jgi:SH3-like domain-containing protein
MILKNKISLFIFAFIFLFGAKSYAVEKIIEQNYFASLRSGETNIRSGPGQNYPIKFTFKIKAIPVKVISEYDNWNEVRDYQGQTGWVSQNLLTKKRTLMVRISEASINMYNKSSVKSKIIFKLENNVIGDYLGCADNWCEIKINGKKGWVEKSNLWGAD